MGVNKVEYGDETLVDLTEDSVTPETLAEGETATNAQGEKIVGVLPIVDLNTLITVDKIGFIDLQHGDVEIRRVDSKGIRWGDMCAMEQTNGDGISDEIEISHGIPIVAGENVTFEVDGDVVKVNAEVDTSNLATVDKIKSIDTWANGEAMDIEDDEGIFWSEKFLFADEEGDAISQGEIYHRMPLVAGENVTFEVNRENQVVKINATGGNSTPSVSLIGTWTVIDEPEIPTGFPLEFTSNGNTYTAIGTASYGPSSWGINALAYQDDNGAYISVYVNNPSGSYGITHGWGDEAYKTITVTKEPTDANAIAWLGNNTNAPKVEIPKEEMPQIRFTSANGSTMDKTVSTFYVDEENPLKLTVEVTGGALQVGDALQVCIRKRFNGSKSNGYRRKYKLQRCAEYIVTEEDLDKRFLTVQVFASGEGSRGYRGLFRDGKMSSTSPLYLRIRRPKGNMQLNDSGQTVDAEFSNIVTIWKDYHRSDRLIRIY